ncbi:hypothetical protein G4Z16_28660 [Streptomyces bathyalis]|uniref:Uncharacterized protein n=1 Tax=Streptomyces bathyalis TaxID=2710756 RepID=A0A7T1TB54_9ACTN|nr:hypothetical protein [Streptomyces bathyalis]QPP09727.1 hypothetical protein G4Z16_28660 [Streptomyces bathyalis]
MARATGHDRTWALPDGAVPLLVSDGSTVGPGGARTGVLGPDAAVWFAPGGGKG